MTSPPPSSKSHQAWINDPVLIGILLMCAATMIFPLMNASVKYLREAEYPITQIIWARYAGHFVFMLVVFLPQRGLDLFKANRPGLQLTRSLLMFLATVCYFTALGYVPLTTAAAISFTTPFVVTALSATMLGEAVGLRRWSAVTFGFIGALMIIRPGSEQAHWAMLLVMASAASFGLYQIYTRRIAGADNADTSAMYGAAVGLILSSFAAPLNWQSPSDLLPLLIFLGLGIWAALGHFLVVKALEHGPASVLAPFGYVQLIGATLFGYFVFNHLPDRWTWAGAAVIVGCGIYIAYRERRVNG